MLARELSAAAKLSSSHASAQLRQLVDKGYAREVHLGHEKRTRYEVADRFYNIYYLLRFSRAGRDRLARLVAFLHDLFGPRGMRSMYPKVLEALRERVFPEKENVRLARRSDRVCRWRPGVFWVGRIGTARRSNSSSKGSEQTRRSSARSMTLSQSGSGYEGLLPARVGAYNWSRPATLRKQKGHSEWPPRKRRTKAAVWVALGYTLSEQEQLEEALAAFEKAVELARVDNSIEQRVAGFGALIGASNTLLNREQTEAAVVTGKRSFEYIRLDDAPNHRYMAAEMIRTLGNELHERAGQREEAVTFWSRASGYASPHDPQQLRDTAAKALSTKGFALRNLERSEEALSAWRNVRTHIRETDPTELRQLAVLAIGFEGDTFIELEQPDDSIDVLRECSKYVRTDDPVETRRKVARMMATAGRLLNLSDRFDESESVCREAMEIDSTCADPWHIWAEAILWQNDLARLGEAETYARHAIALAPEDAAALHTLSDVLAGRGNWTEALDTLERAVHSDGDYKHEEWPGLTDSFIDMVAAGHGLRVRHMLEDASLTKELEPLWLAIRMEFGEEIEPLPAEIMDAAKNIRQEIEVRRS